MTFQVKWLTYMAGYLLPSMVFQHFGRGAKTRRLTNQTATSECLGASILRLVHGSHFQPTCWATREYIKWNLKCWRVICLDNCDHPSMWTFNYCCTASGMAPSTCSFVNDWASWSELYLWLKVDVRSILMSTWGITVPLSRHQVYQHKNIYIPAVSSISHVFFWCLTEVVPTERETGNLRTFVGKIEADKIPIKYKVVFPSPVSFKCSELFPIKRNLGFTGEVLSQIWQWSYSLTLLIHSGKLT